MRDEEEQVSGEGTADAAALSSHPSSPLPHPYIGRWRHRTKLVFRVWPRCKETHLAIREQALIPINGMYINSAGHMEVWNQIKGVKAQRFEMQDEDMEVLAAVPAADARRDGPMTVRAPGTLDEHVKKECWLEVPVVVYPDAPFRTGSAECYTDNAVPRLRNFFAETVEEAVAKSGISCSKVVLVENDEELDEELLAREIVENDALVVLMGSSFPKRGVSGRRARELLTRAKYWVVPGRKPEEEGGALCGYQFCDRFIRWKRRVEDGNRPMNNAERLEVMHANTRAKGQATRRTYFIDATVNRFAERVGMSRQRVMARFLDDGIVDVMIRSVDKVKPVLMRDAESLLRGRVGDAVNTLEFYYRAIEFMSIRDRDKERR